MSRCILLLMTALIIGPSAHAELLLHWNFDEPLGTNVTYDQTMYGRNADLKNGVVRVGDPNFIGVVGFTGVDNAGTKVELGQWLDAPMQGYDFTVAVMFRCQTPSDTYGVIVGWDGLGLGISANAVWSIWATPSSTNEVFYSNVWTDAGWHHLAMTYDNSAFTRKIYLDGQLLGTDVLNSSNGAGQGYWEKEFCVGGRQDSYEVHGLCADVKVWNSTLTSTQVQTEYNALLAEQKTPGDINEDAVVGIDDLVILAENWTEYSY